MKSTLPKRMTEDNLPYIVAVMKNLDRWRLALHDAKWKQVEHFNPPETWCACQQETPTKLRVSLIELSPELHSPECLALTKVVTLCKVRDIAEASLLCIQAGQHAFLKFLLFLQTPATSPGVAIQIFKEAGTHLDQALRLAREYCLSEGVITPLKEFQDTVKVLEKSLKKRGLN